MPVVFALLKFAVAGTKATVMCLSHIEKNHALPEYASNSYGLQMGTDL